MFKKTYGILYEQNAYVFTDLFKELENYYAKGTVSNFFSTFVLEVMNLTPESLLKSNKYLAGHYYFFLLMTNCL